MKFDFFVDEFKLYDVSASQSHEVVAWVLTDNAYQDACDEILIQIERSL